LSEGHFSNLEVVTAHLHVVELIPP